ncbi:hypothetical protein PPL_00548 [Heterostelium album PN500]|uniref:Uncharacterized protein n=1 Tax=Heterostelium pallidum (strain ATCC 26659 / Pp 5 / PN500) TaxID=670386 RepID=D3AWS0_HETP5|nr:hypothetical protein PPL_00548 [Heterostelium album PN500]EFA86743.1 hypothetical protein PPL_00548 [Heterostelium album PN500]|eukprot:XP_020438847.1 hypothetical protein PPL_00548 [Heterostelium album PN500]
MTIIGSFKNLSQSFSTQSVNVFYFQSFNGGLINQSSNSSTSFFDGWGEKVADKSKEYAGDVKHAFNG